MKGKSPLILATDKNQDFDIQDLLDDNERLIFLTQLHVHFNYATYRHGTVKRLSHFCMEKKFDVEFDYHHTHTNARPIVLTTFVEEFERAVRAAYRVKAITREETYPVIRTYDSSGNWERQMNLSTFLEHYL